MFLLREFVGLIVGAINIYSTLLTAWILLRVLMYFGVVEYCSRNKVIWSGLRFLDSIIEPPLEKIRNTIPVVFGGVDLSPMVLYFVLGILRSLCFYFIY